MNAIRNFFLRLLGRDTSIDNIVAPMGKIVRNLEAYAERQAAQAVKHEETATALLTKSKQASNEHNAARNLAGNYRGLIGVAE